MEDKIYFLNLLTIIIINNLIWMYLFELKIKLRKTPLILKLLSFLSIIIWLIAWYLFLILILKDIIKF